jgi:hypothetical protein
MNDDRVQHPKQNRCQRCLNYTFHLMKLKVKLSLCLTKYCALKTYGRLEVFFHTFITSVPDVGEWSSFTPRKEPRVSIGHEPRLPPNRPFRESNPCHPVHSLITILNELSQLVHMKKESILNVPLQDLY